MTITRKRRISFDDFTWYAQFGMCIAFWLIVYVMLQAVHFIVSLY